MTRSPLPAPLAALVSAPLFPGAALLALSCFIIAGAWAFQLIGGLAPCPLCLAQRVPWYILIPTSAVLTVGLVQGWSRRTLLVLFVVALGLTAWAAQGGLFHAGVEYKWWKGPETCTAGAAAVDTLLDFDSLSNTRVPMCDEVPWSLFGISLAGFNFLFSLLGLVISAHGLARVVKGRTP